MIKLNGFRSLWVVARTMSVYQRTHRLILIANSSEVPFGLGVSSDDASLASSVSHPGLILTGVTNILRTILLFPELGRGSDAFHPYVSWDSRVKFVQALREFPRRQSEYGGPYFLQMTRAV